MASQKGHPLLTERGHALLTERGHALLTERAQVPAGVTAELWQHYLLTATYPGPAPEVFRLWTGLGPLTWAGEQYEGLGELLSVGLMESSMGEAEQRLTISISGIRPDLRARMLDDPGPVRVEVQLLVSQDGGSTWTLIPRRFRGVLQNPSLVEEVYSFDVVPRIIDTDRGRVQYWSHEDQQSRHPGDTGFRDLRQITDGVDLRWPP